MSQLTIDDVLTDRYVRGSGTSLRAAEAIAERAPGLRGQVLSLLRSSDGLTDEEMQDRLNLNPSTQRPRRVELVAMGYVADSGDRRPTASGRNAVVWMATKE